MTVAPSEIRSDPIPNATTILVAEDDTMVRAVTARVLGAAGYTVIEAADGEQALDIMRGHAGLIDLLVSDIVMPNLGGVELAKRVAIERPEILILLVTGYNPDDMSILDDETRRVGFLQKPFTPTQLLAKVSTMLAARSGDFASL